MKGTLLITFVLAVITTTNAAPTPTWVIIELFTLDYKHLVLLVT